MIAGSASMMMAASTIDGQVQDSLYQPVEVATVALFRLPDSLFVKAEVTDRDGKYRFADIVPGSYYVLISFLGYKPFYSQSFSVREGEDAITVPDIQLIAEGIDLQEVSVTAQRPFLEQRADRMIINVDNSILSAGSSAMEVLQRSPGVIVSPSDAISIRGRAGVIFMMDGKITPMSGQELANYLRAMPSSDIDRIEIITNPSAKYDAAGNAGIIDIRLKKNTENGTNGTFTASVAQGKYPKAGAGISLNHRKDKFNLYGAYNYNFRKGFNDLRLYRSFYEGGMKTGAYDQKNYLVIPYHFHSARIGVDYYVSKQTVIGVLASGNLNRFKPGGENTSRVENGSGETESYFTTTNRSADQWPSYALNGNIKHTFPKNKQELSVDLDYARYANTTDQTFTTRYYDVSGEEYLPYYLLIGDLNGKLRIRSLKADFTWPVSDITSLETGLKTSSVHADNNLVFTDESMPDMPVFDSTVSNHFIYDEGIQAAYVNMNFRWAKFSLQGGLRLERTDSKGLQLINGESFDRDYTDLFPSIFLNYIFTDNYAMGLNMSRRLDRPSYQQLNPFKFFLDPSTYREGNPYLNPQYTWSFEWNHTLLQRYTLSLSYARTYDNITQVIAPVEGVDRVTVQTDINLGEVDYYSFTAGVPVSAGKVWNSTNTFSVYRGIYHGDYANTVLDNGNWVMDFRTNNTFVLGGPWSAELNFFYHSRELYAYMDLEPMWGLGAGVQTKLFNNKGTLKLSVTDIFWTSLPAADITFRDYTETFDVYRDTRQIALSYTHRFGDTQIPSSRRRVGGAEDEKRRAGNSVQG